MIERHGIEQRLFSEESLPVAKFPIVPSFTSCLNPSAQDIFSGEAPDDSERGVIRGNKLRKPVAPCIVPHFLHMRCVDQDGITDFQVLLRYSKQDGVKLIPKLHVCVIASCVWEESIRNKIVVKVYSAN